MRKYIILLCLALIGCDKKHAPNVLPAVERNIYVDYNSFETIQISELIENIKFIRIDSNVLLHEGGVIKRVLINKNRIAILQSGAACSCSQFLLFDTHGKHIKSVDGFHKGNFGFPWAMDMTFDLSKDRYIVMSRNPGRIIEIDLDGTIKKERILPFNVDYMDLHYFKGNYLFFSDNSTVGQFTSKNILITDNNLSPISKYDPINHIRQQSHSLDKDKIFFDFKSNSFIYTPSIILDSIYTIYSAGYYHPFGKIVKSHNLSKSDLDNIKSSATPTLTMLFETPELYEKTSIINEILRVGNNLVIPTFFKNELYYTLYSIKTGNTISFKLQNESIFRWPISNSESGHFILISAYNFIELTENNLDINDSKNQLYHSIKVMSNDLSPKDNAVIVLFDFNDSAIDNLIPH